MEDLHVKAYLTRIYYDNFHVTTWVVELQHYQLTLHLCLSSAPLQLPPIYLSFSIIIFVNNINVILFTYLSIPLLYL